MVDAEPAQSTIKRDVNFRGVTITGPARYADELRVEGPGAASRHRSELRGLVGVLGDERSPVVALWAAPCGTPLHRRLSSGHNRGKIVLTV